MLRAVPIIIINNTYFVLFKIHLYIFFIIYCILLHCHDLHAQSGTIWSLKPIALVLK